MNLKLKESPEGRSEMIQRIGKKVFQVDPFLIVLGDILEKKMFKNDDTSFLLYRARKQWPSPSNVFVHEFWVLW